MLIRPSAQAVVRRDGDLLVYQGCEEKTQRTFYRLLGGGIEFGERAEEAVRRELLEELEAELTEVRLLGVLENIFEYDGRTGHEIVFVFEAELVDRSLYDREDLGTVRDTGDPVSWQPIARFIDGEVPVYPRGLLRMLGVA